MRESRIVITLDGLAGSGKSSLAATLAKTLGYLNFNSGLVYRVVGFLALHEQINPHDETALVALIKRHKIELAEASGTFPVLLDGAPVAADLRSPEVSESTSQVSRFAQVRALLLPMQRTAYPGQNLVAEGRDMGTVVFPDALVKFFVQASVEVRTQRRLKQLGYSADAAAQIEAIRKEILERDERDAGRAVAPTVAASDAIIVDNSDRPFEELVAELAQIVRNKVASLS